MVNRSKLSYFKNDTALEFVHHLLLLNAHMFLGLLSSCVLILCFCFKLCCPRQGVLRLRLEALHLLLDRVHRGEFSPENDPAVSVVKHFNLFVFSNQTYNETSRCALIIHPVSGVGIQTHDHESPPITPRSQGSNSSTYGFLEWWRKTLLYFI